MAIAYDSNGSDAGTIGVGGVYATTVSYPATVASGDLLILRLVGRAGTSVDSVDLPSGWTNIGTVGIGTTVGSRAAYKKAAGTEGGTTQACTGTYTGAGGPLLAGIIERWTGVDGTTQVYNAATNSGSSTTPAPASVTTTQNGDVAYFGMDTRVSTTVGNITGETGGDYTETYAETHGGGNAITQQTQIATLASTGTISGGTCTLGTTGAWNVFSFAIKATAVATSGSLASTLAATTLAGSGTETAKGSLTQTLASATLSAAGSETAKGSLAVTLADTTLSAAGSETAKGSLAQTLAAVTLNAAGSETAKGSLVSTLADTTLSAAGSASAKGALVQTLADTTLAGAGNAAVHGSLTQTLADITFSGAGSGLVSGAVTQTLADTILSAQGSESAKGSLASSLADTTLLAQGSEASHGALGQTLDDTTLVAGGSFGGQISGSLSSTLADTTLSAQGSSTVHGACSTTLDDVTCSASGHSHHGALSQTLGDVTCAGEGTAVGAPITGSLAVTLDNVTLFPNTFIVASTGGGISFERRPGVRRKKRDEEDLKVIMAILANIDEDDEDVA